MRKLRQNSGHLLLPPTFEGWGKVIVLLCVSVNTSRGVPHPANGEGGLLHPRSRWGGTSSQVQMGGTPSQFQMGAPQVWMGAPHPRSRWGVPHQAVDGEGVPPSCWWGGGVPPSENGWGNPIQDWMGVPYPELDRVPPSRTGWGTPPRSRDRSE